MKFAKKNPRAYINGLVNLKDVDTAKGIADRQKDICSVRYGTGGRRQ